MKIVVGDRNVLPHREQFEAGLPADAEVVWCIPFDENRIIDELADADVYVGGKFSAAMGAAAPNLRMVHVAGAGTDNVDRSRLGPDVQVCNTFHHEQSIAEYVVAATVMLRRKFLQQDRALRAGRFATAVYDPSIAQPLSLSGARIGFVGFGHIGRKTWQLFRAYGATGAAVTGSGRAPDEGLEWVADARDLTRLADFADVLVVSAPLNEHTRGMIGAEELRRLGEDGILVNVGRGPLVQEQPLFDALSRNEIAAAAIDVWYRYPGPDGVGEPSSLPFRELDNVLMTPHSSGVTHHTFVGRVADIASNVDALAASLSR
ncbi:MULTISPECIES: 2-hydroxyacid dehydrogenase [unclassified Rhodococcus (in: high G+C Gram-positive bacteria)]|uniref:2-hydroxyacid dehydrogenase n=1 Tax=unclassified Rhodococcus (in: high G+C Gram-positive bacteria) TaxID=192944 RepID=UPI000B9C5287|nr:MULTISPECIES: 2-hydroxyacid dehydrogenase [unclassified Rhodococcus (in: high G+C Gram-positive bacteria)]OZE34800.1 hydroxyacid dehydrogenase [Rhodococcus sp. 05-2254-4]OZE46156.1 hydroxyacid dehydrogenase [Rhodococcus sp. 05-2254-2]OZE51505.1 hydroxyacid dehydrogenase [Rhodococcus sp. 05-2254-3]